LLKELKESMIPKLKTPEVSADRKENKLKD
jgi:hypothetical protein